MVMVILTDWRAKMLLVCLEKAMIIYGHLILIAGFAFKSANFNVLC